MVEGGRRLIAKAHANKRITLAHKELLDSRAHQPVLVAVGSEAHEACQPLGGDVEKIRVKIRHGRGDIFQVVDVVDSVVDLGLQVLPPAGLIGEAQLLDINQFVGQWLGGCQQVSGIGGHFFGEHVDDHEDYGSSAVYDWPNHDRCARIRPSLQGHPFLTEAGMSRCA